MDDTPQNPDQNPDRLLTEIEAADLLALTPRALQAWRQREKGPAFVKAGSSVRYRRAAIEAWLDGRTVRNAANPRRSENAFPPKLVAYLADEIRKAGKAGHRGEPCHTAAAHGRLIRALRTHERDLALALVRGRGADLPGGRILLEVGRHPDFKDNLLTDHQSTVQVTYNPRTGEWISDTAASIRRDFLDLVAHVWRVQGLDDDALSDGTATRLFAFLGVAAARYFVAGDAE